MLRILDIRPQLPGYVAFDNILLKKYSVYQCFYTYATIRIVPGAFCFWAGHASLIIYWKFVNTVCWKPVMGILPNLQP